MKKDLKSRGGVATIYRQKIDLTWSPRDNGNWLNDVSTFYARRDSFDREFIKTISSFFYKVGDDEAMLYEIKRSLEATEQFMLPVLDEVTDIETCIEHLFKFGPSMILREDLGATYKFGQYDHYEEGLLLIKMDKYDERYTRFRGEKVRMSTARDVFLNDPELSAKAFAELERRKVANVETLRSYGLDL